MSRKLEWEPRTRTRKERIATECNERRLIPDQRLSDSGKVDGDGDGDGNTTPIKEDGNGHEGMLMAVSVAVVVVVVESAS